MERRLGRGLSSLLGEKDPAEAQKKPVELPLERIRPNPFQPRKTFEPGALEELTRSIRQHGVMQPVAVRAVGEGFELISGERRLRASKAAGLAMIPVVIRDAVSDQDMLELALVENVQRQDLDAIERAVGFRLMMQQLQLTQEQVADKVGLQRSTVANHVRLLDLPEAVQQGVARGLISMGHARALLSLRSAPEQSRWMERIAREDLSVRQTEQLVKVSAKSQAPQPDVLQPQQAPWARDLEERFKRRFGTRVLIKNLPGYKGEISIEYFNRADLERICELLDPRKPV